MKTQQDVFNLLQQLMVKEFELDASQITPDANLYEDLDLDSIDAVDLVVKLREITGKKIEPEAFKSVRTVNDVVNAVYVLIEA
ncbi:MULTISPECIES: acyl carrier protein [Rheinheimera]|uniref:Acyl carrier protein n=1 Tax=Rheinheimera aquimaris TaxID=412437 RepID=A0ABP3NIV8_9GAMM|nr:MULTISPECIES: acyl carrier protein [Rheinheimera]MCB5213019.1 acyl carrier protein [Rheinheimera aquimaris]MCD1596891.1 acyl carrier protein [Rheinheimera aquimaris]|tara:strand:- start:157 stop:405 length:249 start_codon:yes stop_codon:yes gene_type:complete